MTRPITISLIGIGSGNPEHLTLEAIRMMNEAELIMIPEKGDEKETLALLRETMLNKHTATPYLRFALPVRDKNIKNYEERVFLWHKAIAQSWQEIIDANGDVSHFALLIWGDPSLYDSTLRIAANLEDEYEITLHLIPGITSIQALTAAHRIPLNNVNEPLFITTGRRIRDEGIPPEINRAVVMLDGECSFQNLDGHWEIHWSAFAGMENEMNISGHVKDVTQKILDARETARQNEGWIMDIYLLQRITD